MRWIDLSPVQKVNAAEKYLRGTTVAHDVVVNGSITLYRADVEVWFDSYSDDPDVQEEIAAGRA